MVLQRKLGLDVRRRSQTIAKQQRSHFNLELIPAAFVGDSRQCGDVAKVEVS
jgi:hypothetical protein